MFLEQTIPYNSPIHITMSLEEAFKLQECINKLINAHAAGFAVKVGNEMLSADVAPPLYMKTSSGEIAACSLHLAVTKNLS